MVDNVLLVVFDALRFDRVMSGTSPALTPNIDGVLKDGEGFTNCFSCSNVTDSCLTTIMTGMYPTRHGIINHGAKISEANLKQVASTMPLAERLRPTHTTLGVNRKRNWHERGYDRYVNPDDWSKGSVMSSLSGAVDSLPDPLSRAVRTAYDKGLSLYLSVQGESVRTDERLMKRELERFYPSAESTTGAAVDLLEDTESPWYLHTHYWDAHIPYNPTVTPPDFVRERTYEDGDVELDEALDPIRGSRWAEELERAVGHADTVGDVKRLYDAAAWYADREFGRLIDVLKRRGEYEDTIIVLTADHGESLTEHGILFEHHGLYDVSTHVPLVIKAPGFSGSESRFVQHFDIVPTVLDLLDVGYEPGEFDGRSLVPSENGVREIERDAVYMESKHKSRKRAIRTAEYRYITRIGDRDECRFCGIPHGDDRELYDLTVDPGETDNIARSRPDVADELDRKLEAYVNELPDTPRGRIDFEPPEEQLRELGYF